MKIHVDHNEAVKVEIFQKNFFKALYLQKKRKKQTNL